MRCPSKWMEMIRLLLLFFWFYCFSLLSFIQHRIKNKTIIHLNTNVACDFILLFHFHFFILMFSLEQSGYLHSKRRLCIWRRFRWTVFSWWAWIMASSVSIFSCRCCWTTERCITTCNTCTSSTASTSAGTILSLTKSRENDWSSKYNKHYLFISFFSVFEKFVKKSLSVS